MSIRKSHAGVALAFALACLMAEASWAVTGCNLGCPTWKNGTCVAACSTACGIISVWDSGVSTCAGAGSFDLSQTEFLNTCSNIVGSCTNIKVPPFRFWAEGEYLKAGNSGCPDLVATQSLGNGDLDFGQPAVPAHGHWSIYQANWGNPAANGDGCVSTSASQRTVGEMSFPDGPAEGTAGHKGWYGIASVPASPADGSYDFNAITGAATCGASAGNDIPVINIPALTITTPVRAPGSCTGNLTPTQDNVANANDATYFDVGITLANGSPDYYTEGGKNDAAHKLIAGTQILYTTGAAEPTSSDACTGNWTPAFDPISPAPKKAAAIVPWGTTTATISLPKAGGALYWLATRLVYTDAANPAAPWDPSVGTNGPRIFSAVSTHCGPVMFNGVITAVTYDSVTATRTPSGVVVNWKTSTENDTTGFVVYRSTSASGSENMAEAAPFVDSVGPGTPYTATDTTVASDHSRTYYYFVQEYTMSGPGTKSDVVREHPAAVQGTATSAGGRARSAHRNR